MVRRIRASRGFHRAVEEVAATIIPYLVDHNGYREAQTLRRMTEPKRLLTRGWVTGWCEPY